MKRVVILSAFVSPFRSGAEACAEEVAVRLSDQFEVTIVTARLHRDLPRREKLSGKVDVFRIGLGLPVDKWLYPFLAPLAVRSLRPTLVHAILETFAGAALLCTRAIYPAARRLLTLQTTNTDLLRTPIIRSAQMVTAISEILATDARKRGARSVTVIPNGIDAAAIKAAAGRFTKVPNRLLFVGRLEPMKGIDTLLKALVLLPKNREWKLRIVGDGSLRKSLESLVKDLKIADRVTFTGRLRDEHLWREYAEAEIFCGLSRSEALGNVFLEAQAAGCAVVATRVGGIPEIVLDGQTGVLVAPDNPSAAAAAIDGLLGNPPSRLAFAATGKRFAERFDWNGIAGAYAELWRQLS